MGPRPSIDFRPQRLGQPFTARHSPVACSSRKKVGLQHPGSRSQIRPGLNLALLFWFFTSHLLPLYILFCAPGASHTLLSSSPLLSSLLSSPLNRSHLLPTPPFFLSLVLASNKLLRVGAIRCHQHADQPQALQKHYHAPEHSPSHYFSVLEVPTLDPDPLTHFALFASTSTGYYLSRFLPVSVCRLSPPDPPSQIATGPRLRNYKDNQSKTPHAISRPTAN
ncbi:hypothetical protein N5P37_002279 [Trichoderma harzianum]|nr:hypothetical protein N5P37_002279 [Trichoderma harzianum]